MKTVSLKIDNSIFVETEIILATLKKSRNRYINEAIANYNTLKRRELIKKQLKIESKLVGEDSLRVLHEFENLDYAD